MNPQPSLLPSPNHVTRRTVVQKAWPWPCDGQRHPSRNPSGPCRHRLHHSLPVSHELQTASSPLTWLTWRKQPVLSFYLFIFCNNLKALFTAPSTATQSEFMRGVGGGAWTTHVVLKVSRIIEPNGKAYSTNSTRVQIRFQTQWLLEKKRKLTWFLNVRLGLKKNWHQTSMRSIFFLKEEVILMEKIA